MKASKWQTLAAMAGLMVSATAGAQEVGSGGGSFGNAGQIVISTDASASLGYSTQGDGIGFVSLEPGADYFLKQNLSVGAGMQLRAAFSEGEDPVGFGLNARAGYRYEASVSYRDDIYNVVIREQSPRGAWREVAMRDLASCAR